MNRTNRDETGGRTTAPAGLFVAAFAAIVVSFSMMTTAPVHGGAVVFPSDQPLPAETATEWVDGDIPCDAVTVEQTREVTLTPYVWDELSDSWVPDPSGSVTEVQTRVRQLDDVEIETCPLPPQPPDVIEVSGWVDGEIECDATTVVQTRTVTSTPYSFVIDPQGAGLWELFPEGSTAEIETRTRDLDDAELLECPPSTTVVPDTTSPEPPDPSDTGVPSLVTIDLTPSSTTTEPVPIVFPDSGINPSAPAPPAGSGGSEGGELPVTGAGPLSTGLIAGLFIALGAAIQLAARRRSGAHDTLR